MITPKNEKIDEAQVVLIRHGLSMLNIEFRIQGFDYDEDTPEKHALEKDPAYVDAHLHPIGIM